MANYSDYKANFKEMIELGDITQHNLKQLKVVNAAALPLTYQEGFYKGVPELGELAKLAYFKDIVVGGVCAKVDQTKESNKLYIMTLAVLAPYRRLGIASMLLEHLISFAQNNKKINEISLHVQTNNDEAIAFYERFGFDKVEKVPSYYKRIEPSDAFLLRRML